MTVLPNSLVKGRPHVATGNEPVLAVCAAFGFAEVGKGIRDGGVKSGLSVALSGHEVGPSDVLDGATTRGRQRRVRRSVLAHTLRISQARTNGEHVANWMVRSRLDGPLATALGSMSMWRGKEHRCRFNSSQIA